MSRKTRWLIAGLVGGAGLGLWAYRHEERLRARRFHNRSVSVLVVGAGTVGTTYANRLAREGVHVDIVARGARAQAIREYGLRVRDLVTWRLTQAEARVLERVPKHGEYDLVIIAVRLPQLAEALSQTAELARVSPVLVLGSVMGGIEPLAQEIGDRALLLGQPAIGGAMARRVTFALPFGLGTTVIGESDGAQTQRLRQTASILRRAGLRVQERQDIVPWLATQAAIAVVFSAAVIRNAGSLRRVLWRHREIELVRAGTREALGVLMASGLPVTPADQLTAMAQHPARQRFSIRLGALPNWVGPMVEGRAASGRDETAFLIGELSRLARERSIPIPALEQLAEPVTAIASPESTD